jgi:uncharacterized protein YjlB
MIEHIEPLAVRFVDDGMIPNNPRFPVLIYVRAFSPVGSDPAATVEKLLGENRWTPQWRDGIYDFHHYHSTAHETLAIAKGTVNVRLGGERGEDFDLGPGDIAVLPAGTGHKRLSQSPGLLVVGAYPPGQQWDIMTGRPGERPNALRNIESVPLPESDPSFGADGPLTRLWR